MNTDIRLSVNFFNHIKTLRLKKACGLEGIVGLQKLWVWAAVNRPSGDLSGFSAPEIEAVCDWGGDEGCFISALREIGWLDGEEGSFQLHGWEEFQLWARGAEKREDMGRMSALARKNYAAFQRIKAQGGNSVSKEEYARLTKAGYHAEPDPGPTPIPIPVPIPTPKKKVMGAEKPKDQKTKTDFERKWDGEPYQKFSPLDYIRKIQEIAKNAPKIPERVLRAPDTSTLESEENTNGKEQNDGRRAA